jgi:hypothetical protein
MAEQSHSDLQDGAELRGRLDELSQLLSQADHLGPDAQQDLASLVAELAQALRAGQLEPATIQRLAKSTSETAEALRHQHKGLLSSARDGLEHLVVQAEDSHPVVTRLAERLIEVLSNIGI